MRSLLTLLKTLGELRTVLVGIAWLCIVASLFATQDIVRTQGWGVFPDILAPVISVILLFVLMLDVLMSRVFMSEQDQVIQRRFRTIIRTELVSVLLLVVVWTPYMIHVLS